MVGKGDGKGAGENRKWEEDVGKGGRGVRGLLPPERNRQRTWQEKAKGTRYDRHAPPEIAVIE